jgi:hypothetical protein
MTLTDHIDQAGITYGPAKLALMQKACRLQNVPLDESNVDENGNTIDDTLRVKLFDPCSSWTWYIQGWDGENICFGLVVGFEKEWGSFSLKELSSIRGQLGIGIEIDTYFTPVQPYEIK